MRLRKQLWRVVRGGVVVIALALLFLAYHGKMNRVKKPSPTAITITTLTANNNTGISIQEEDERNDDPLWAPNATPPRDAPPSPILVGPYVYRVRYRDVTTMPGLMGATYPERELILLRNDLNFGQLRETLLHEAGGHACLHVGTGGDVWHVRNDDEFIEAQMPTFLALLRNNPKLVKWLSRRPLRGR